MPEEHNETLSRQPAPRSGNNLGVPIAIVIAAALIAGAIYFSNSSTNGTGSPTGTAQPSTNEQETPERTYVPINEDDHVRGNPNAPIVLIEYSDFDCPFCKNFHETMTRIMDEYGETGRVAWVYRHFPIEQLHPNAPMVAEASECVAELAGNDGFWTFADLVFSERGTNDPTDPTRITEFATRAGAEETAFESCLESSRHEASVTADFEESIAAGGTGTPYTLVFVGNEFVGPINGAQQYTLVKSNIDSILTQIEGGLE